MTVGAVVVPAGLEDALADAAGRVAVRRIVDAAWAGGALPIIVVADDDADGHVSAALQGSPAVLVAAGGSTLRGTYRVGLDAALAAVAEMSAALLWPGHMIWIDPETVTSLIEAHGRAPGQVARPLRAGETGWPVLLPVDRATELFSADGEALDEALDGLAIELLELGDPGSVLGREVSIDELPDYAGPPEPVGGPPPEWGAAAADTAEPEVPLRSP